MQEMFVWTHLLDLPMRVKWPVKIEEEEEEKYLVYRRSDEAW